MKRILYCGMLLALVTFSGCTNSTMEDATTSNESGIATEEAKDSETVSSNSTDADTSDDSASSESTEQNTSIDYFADYTSDIKKEVEKAVDSSASLQEEIKNVEKVGDKYTNWAKKAETQAEMNMSSTWFYYIWDNELNLLWSRISNTADAKTKERILTDQRNWISMKDEVVLENLGPEEEGGSIYPLLQNGLLEELTHNRCNVLASELAKIKGESFNMPERSMYGTYVDNQGTGDVYGSLITHTTWENEDEAVITISGLTNIKGPFKNEGNGKLSFTSDEGDVKGIISINGWDGASFKVTESSNSLFNVGDAYNFDFVF